MIDDECAAIVASLEGHPTYITEQKPSMKTDTADGNRPNEHQQQIMLLKIAASILDEKADRESIEAVQLEIATPRGEVKFSQEAQLQRGRADRLQNAVDLIDRIIDDWY